MNMFLLIVTVTLGTMSETNIVSEHSSLLSCYAAKAQYKTSDLIKYECIKKSKYNAETK